MNLELIPGRSIGDFEIGMPREALEARLNQGHIVKENAFFEDWVSIIDKTLMMNFDLDARGRVIAIEAYPKNILTLNGKDVFKLSKAQLQRILKSLDAELVEDRDGYSSIALGMAFFFEEGKKNAGAAMVFSEEYFTKAPKLDPGDRHENVTIEDLYRMLE